MKVQDEPKPEKLRLAWGDCSFRRHPGDGPPLVLLHPLALSGRIWELTREELIEGREVVAVDLRGHGDSGWSGESFTVENMADDRLRRALCRGYNRMVAEIEVSWRMHPTRTELRLSPQNACSSSCREAMRTRSPSVG
jgi:hypothetical protein